MENQFIPGLELYRGFFFEVIKPILAAQEWREREEHLCQAYEFAAEMHNALGNAEPLESGVRFFHNRPYRVIDVGRFVNAFRAAITDQALKDITTDIGSIDQFSQSTDLRSYPKLHKKLQSLYK